MKTLAQLAQDALNVQDAVNLHAVVNGFSRAIADLKLLMPVAGSDELQAHPIVQCWADKVAHLTGTQQSSPWKAFEAVEAMAKDIKWSKSC